MDVSHILDGLNDPQRHAVTAPLGSYLILAGAGSGKTRVLTNTIAWLIQTEGASPYSVLAVTFTNKAAAEIRSRIESLLEMPVRARWRRRGGDKGWGGVSEKPREREMQRTGP